MAIRRILVPIVGIADAQRLLHNAFTLADRLKARVTVCDTAPPDYPYLDPSGVLPPDMYENLVKQVLAQQEHLRTASRSQFEAAAKQHGIQISEIAQSDRATATWIGSGDFRNVVWGLGRLTDLIIARRPTGSNIADQDTIEQGLFAARRPVLLLPPKGAHLEQGAVIAWNGSLEAATALERAVDMLNRSEPVTVLQVGDNKPGALDITEALAYLDSHGFKATSKLLPDAPKATGETILKTATDLKAGVIVVGAYSHSRIREDFLGGVTVTLMKKSHIPLFFAN